MSKQYPAIVKIGDRSVDFSILNRNQNSQTAIEYNNRKIFELLNPLNKFSKNLILDSIVKFKKPIQDINSNKSTFHHFIDKAIYKLTRDDFGVPSSNKVSALKKKVLERDPVILNTLRSALIEDTGLPLVIDFISNSDNCIDFYFDSVKEYTKDHIEGIVLNDDGIVNKNSLTLVAFINMKYIIKSISQEINTNNESEVQNINNVFEQLKIEIRNSFWAAVIRDDFRMRMTEKFMLTFKLLMNNNFSFINTTQVADPHLISQNERVVGAVKEFISNNKNTIDSINDDNANSLSFNLLMKICLDIDFNPITLLSILEPSDYDISEILNQIFGSIDIQHFASHKTLQIKEEDEKSVNEIKDTLLIDRILPLCFIVVYYLQNGLKYRDFQEIDKILEEEIHSKDFFLSSSNGTSRLMELHKVNDEFYNDLRRFVQNPLNTTEKVKMIVKDIILGSCDENKVDDEDDLVTSD